MFSSPSGASLRVSSNGNSSLTPRNWDKKSLDELCYFRKNVDWPEKMLCTCGRHSGSTTLCGDFSINS